MHVQKRKMDSEFLKLRNRALLSEYISGGRTSEKILANIISNNILLAKKKAKEYYDRCNLKSSIIDMEDLEQEAIIGIISAAKKYDDKKKFEFSTYLFFWIKQKIIRSVQNTSSTIRIPAYLKQEISKISKNSDDVKNSESKILKAYSARMINNPEHENDKSKNNNKAEIDEEYEAINKIFLEKFIPKLKKLLNDREFKTLISRVIEEKTLQKISEELGVTRERVRQIEKKAIDKLRNEEEIAEFLTGW